MPENISVTEFLREAWDDFHSPTTSTFVSRLGQCRATVAALEETLDYDRSGLNKMKKALKAIHSSGNLYISSDNYLAENLEKLGQNSQREPDNDVCAAFQKFAIVTKELSAMMKNLMQQLNNIILFPLDTFLHGDFSGVRGDLKKPFDKAWKDYDSKFNKIEKEKKQLAKDAGLIKTEVTGAEIAEEMERERQVLQFQMCEYLLKVNEIKTKKGVDLLQHYVEYYHAQANFFQEGLKMMEHFRCYIEGLVTTLERLKSKQGTERRNLLDLRDALKERMASYKETTPAPSGYSLHQLKGNKMHGHEKNGFLLKKSEGKIKKVWQKRRCTVKDGILSISHSDTTKEPVKLNLLTCQVKLVPEDLGKKCFDLISSSKNRTYHFQADDSNEMDEWISVLNNAKELVLMKAFGEHSASSSEPYTQSIKELTRRIIQEIKRLPGNQHCCDCGAPAPEWLSVNLGVLICLECCGVHRDMGVHVSRTQSIVIDELNTAQLLLARNMSNSAFNDIMEVSLHMADKPIQRSSMDDKKVFIRNKYEKRRYIMVTCPNPEDRRADLKAAITSQELSTLLQVFAEGVDLMAALPDTENGENALHLAIINDNSSSPVIVDFIIQNSNSQELGRRTSDGNTALHLCAWHNRTEAMKLLLRTQPDLVNHENTAGETALDIASRLKHDVCVDLLSHAVAGKCDLFGNLNIEWNFTVDEHTLDYSDDELEATTPERKMRSRPPSLVMGSDRELSSFGSGLSLHDRSLTTDNLKFNLSSGFPMTGRPKLASTSDSIGSSTGQMPSTSSIGLASQRDSTLRKKTPAPPPPAHRGHLRNPSDPGFGQMLSGRMRSPSDPPPPLPQKVGRARVPELSLPGPPPTQVPPQTSSKPPPNPRLSRVPNTFQPPGEGTRTDLPPPPIPAKPRILASANVGQLQPGLGNNDRKTLYVPSTNDAPQKLIERKRKRCVANFKCEADNEDELSFVPGEIIIILAEDEDEWWEGEIEGEPSRRGMFPTPYVSVIEEENRQS